MSKAGDLLKITTQLIEDVRKKLGVTQDDIDENIKAIRTWLEKTPHLPDERSDERLENFLLKHSMSIEKTKKALESYFSAKNVIGEYFDNLLPYSMMYQKAKSYTCVVAMPDMLNEYSRLTIHKLSNIDSELYEPLEAFTLMTMITEIRLAKDYSHSDVIIIDLSGYSLKHLMKFTPKMIKKLRILITKTFNYKVNSIHVINVPQYTDKVMPIFRSVVPGKIYKKVHIHMTYESLYQYIPKPYLPVDYGGDQASLIDLFTKWCDEIENHAPYFTEYLIAKSDEFKRLGRCHEFEIFGTGSDGSFKKINVEL